MFRKTDAARLAGTMLLFASALSGCGSGTDHAYDSSRISTQESSPIPSLALSPSPSPASSPMAQDTRKEDDSIRAIGIHPDGRLLVKPASKASVAPLGAPGCYGLETDLSWSGDYETVWESKTDGAVSVVATFPIDFEIVQQGNEPVGMRKFSMGDTEIFAYIPRYTDCHSLETYLFGVKDGKAFPIPFQMEPDRSLPYIGQLPIRPFRETGSGLIVTGGYGAGQDFIDVYHFRYDPEKRSMILQSTDQVKSNDVMK